MSGETTSNSNEQPNPQAEQWQSLQPSSMTDEQKRLVQEGIYGLDGKPTKEYLESRAGKNAVAAAEQYTNDSAKIARYLDHLDEQVKAGAFTKEEAQKYYKKLLAKDTEALRTARDQIEGYRQDYIDGKQEGISEKDWIDDPEIHSREEVIAEHEAALAQPAEATSADEVEKISATESEKETTTADEQEKEATLEAEKEGTFLEDAENVTPEQAEANKAEHQDAIKNEALGTRLESEENLSVAEAEAKLAEHQEALARLEAASGTERAEAPDPRRLEALENHLGELRVELAELFVKKNRILGPKHRAEYNEARDKYEAALENYLRLKSKTDEELFQNYLEEDNKLLEDVDNQVDNGNFFRKIISRTLGNEYYKQAMHAHGARSLGVAGAESVRPNPNSRQPEAIPAPSQAEVTPAASPEPAPAESTPESAPEPEPAPEPAPESVSEPESSQTTEGSAEDTAEGTNEKPFEQAPESEPSPEERAFDEGNRDVRLGQIRNYFYETPLNDEGYDIISLDRATVNDVAGQREINNRIADWWEGLDDEQKDRVRQYENDNLDSRYGGALRYWLQQHNEL